ncbi:MAG: thioredoxin domain-containing protein [Coriobacteriia bacterium]
MPNRLSAETSPYLWQHADNPVDWYPWGPDAFEKAAREDKPIFLSIGYSACHWCHVMAHESFESQEVADVLNASFVSIKVDREERPDIDAIYMEAVQALTGAGGWPMSIFMTAGGVPFFGGTYFPAEQRHGAPSFLDILGRISQLWQTRRQELLASGLMLKEALANPEYLVSLQGPDQLGKEALDRAVANLKRAFDAEHGGFGGAPKFPQPAIAEFLLRRYTESEDERLLGMVLTTLDHMIRGGIWDHLGGGFHRYSTDAAWLVPHFEKMLYDNAQLARLYLHAWQLTGDERYRQTTIDTLDYLVREMLDSSGGFYSAQDADTDGEEGRFFTWTPEEIRVALRETAAENDADLFMEAYGVTLGGNFEGRSVLSEVKTAGQIANEHDLSAVDVAWRISVARETLRAARETRPRPATDEKVLAGWNGLALAAFAEAGRVLGRADYTQVAEHNAEFLLTRMRTPEGRLLRSWSNGQAKLNGYLEDYAACAEGLLELYQTTFELKWFEAARTLGDITLKHFLDSEGGFFDTSDDHEELLFRPKELQDGAIPSAGSMAAGVFARLAEYTADDHYAEQAERALVRVQGATGQAPLGFAHWLCVLDFVLAPPRTLAVIGKDRDQLLRVVWRRYLPNVVVAAAAHGGGPAEPKLLEYRVEERGLTTAYLCRHGVCERPTFSADELAEQLAGL